jgi:hypothetical protein
MLPCSTAHFPVALRAIERALLETNFRPKFWSVRYTDLYQIPFLMSNQQNQMISAIHTTQYLRNSARVVGAFRSKFPNSRFLHSKFCSVHWNQLFFSNQVSLIIFPKFLGLNGQPTTIEPWNTSNVDDRESIQFPSQFSYRYLHTNPSVKTSIPTPRSPHSNFFVNRRQSRNAFHLCLQFPVLIRCLFE